MLKYNKISLLINNRQNKKKVIKIKKKKTYAYAKRKRRAKSRTNYLKRKRSGLGLKNFEKIFVTEVMWYEKRRGIGRNPKRTRLRRFLFEKSIKFPTFLLKSLNNNTLYSLKKQKNTIRELSIKDNFISKNGILSNYLRFKLLKLSKGHAYASALWKRLMGFFIKKGKKSYIKKEIRMSLHLTCKIFKFNLLYLYFFFEYWFKFSFHLRLFSIYKRKIRIPILERRKTNKRSIILLTNWMKEGVLKRNKLPKLHLKLLAELVDCLRCDRENSSVLINYRIFKNSFRVETIANIQYLRTYDWTLV